MKTNYQKALDYLYRADLADTPEEATLFVAKAQVYATLALSERMEK